MDANGSIFDGINDLAGHVPILDHSMEFAAQYVVYLIVAIAVASWFLRAGTGQNRRIAVYTAAAATAIALVAVVIIQHAYTHPRPFVDRNDVVLLIDHSRDSSFPSEHATAAFAIAAGIGLYRHRIGIALLGLAALAAISRVYDGVHYPADVAGGAAIGIVSALAVWSARGVLAWVDSHIVVRLVPSQLR